MQSILRTTALSIFVAVATAGLCALEAQDEAGGGFASSWPLDIERTWVGPEYYANRLQDWHVAGGRLECVEASPGRPMRVVHLLTGSLRAGAGRDDGAGGFTMSVRTGPIELGGEPSAAHWSGFLVGAGGRDVDYRLTALVHHRPAADGGLCAAVDGTGRVVFLDFEHNVAQGGWAITGRLEPGELAELPATAREGPGAGSAPLGEVELTLAAERSADGGSYALTLSARRAGTGELSSRATLAGVDPRLVEGSAALCSHGGPGGSRLGHWFRDWRIAGPSFVRHEERAFGPILCAQHTLSHGVLKLTAQMPPLGEDDEQTAELQVRGGQDGAWRTVSAARLIVPGYTFPFRVEGWDGRRDTPYRVVYRLRRGGGSSTEHAWEGTVRREPVDRDELVVAAFTGNKHFTGGIRWNDGGVWFPHRELVAAVRCHRPDLLFFSGDQIYEGDLTGAQREPLDKAMLDYLDKWNRWCWAFGDLARDLPCICIPDDHDVYHGNVWGAGGRHAERQDDGGYRMPASFVDMVQRTQTSHLPDPYDPTPVLQGIGVYYTSVEYAGVSFAVIEDRKFKSSPTVMVPAGKCVNGWFQNPDFDPAREADVPGAVLLGERQLAFLRAWGADWRGGVRFKAVLSQTIFANVATLPEQAASDAVVPGLRHFAPDEYPADDVPAADADSNGWPQAGRNRALREIRRAFAVHIAGDQHLGSLTRYGVDDWDDAGYALCVPSIANTWPRRWFPRDGGLDREAGAPRYTGRFVDGFGNKVRVVAVSNPVVAGREPAALYDRAPGYGIVRFDKQTRKITFECWPRWVDPAAPGAQQYPGWPWTVDQMDNYDRKAFGWLPEVVVEGMADPVVQVVAEAAGEVVYTVRIRGSSFRPRVFEDGSYTVRVGEPGTPRMKTVPGLSPTSDAGARVVVRF